MNNSVMFVIEYDNGQDYEDHSSWPILVAPTRERAQQIIDEIYEWAQKMNEEAPDKPETPSYEWTDADFDLLDKRREWSKQLKCPYDLDELQRMAEECNDVYHPSLEIREIPFIQ